MSNAVTQYTNADLDSRKEYARVISTADDMLPKGLRGIIKDANGNNVQAIVPGKVLLVLETGRMLGIDPMAALQGINVIEGSASISPALMTALVRKAGHKIRVDLTGSLEQGDLKATARLTRADEPDEPYFATWTPHDAVTADLADSYEPDPATGLYVFRARSKDNNKLAWEKYTRNLLKWRAVGDVVRDGAEEVLMGVHYTPEELGAVVEEDGRVEPITVYQFTELEDEAIARIKEIDDKADMVVLWEELHTQEVWSARVEAAFASHITSLSKDSRPPVDGAPGNTGVPEFDGTPTTPSEPNPAPTSTPTPAPSGAENVPTPHAGAQRREDIVDVDPEPAATEEFDEHAAFLREQEIEEERQRLAEEPARRFKSSALDGK